MILTLFAKSTAPAAADEVSLELSTVENSDGILVREGDRPVLQYQLVTKSLNDKHARSNYVHPLFDLDGSVITEDFPVDHLHHRGIFWAWHQVWVGEKKIGDPWLCDSFEWQTLSSSTRKNPNNSVTLKAMVAWKSPHLTRNDGTMNSIVREETAITIYAATPTYRIVDFQIELQALLPDVKIGGSEDEKGYGGFSSRIKLSTEQRFVSNSGEIDPAIPAMTAGPWLDISDGKSGVAMMTHPGNPGVANQWILRRKRSMKNCVYPGRNPVALSTDKPTVLRYRLVIHRGTASDIPLDMLMHDFSNQPETS